MLAAVRRIDFVGVGRGGGRWQREEGRGWVGGRKKAGRLRTASCSGSGKGDRTRATEVPSSQKNRIDSVGTVMIGSSSQGEGSVKENSQVSGLNIWLGGRVICRHGKAGVSRNL